MKRLAQPSLGTPHIDAEVFLTGVTGNITAQPPA
jgi:hypothetical protein